MKSIIPSLLAGWFLCIDSNNEAWVIPAPYATKEACEYAGTFSERYVFCIPGPATVKAGELTSPPEVK